MNLFPPILFIAAEYDSSGRYTLSAVRRNGADAAGIEAARDGRHVVAVVICGHGVITKPLASDVARRVEADSRTFLSSREGDAVSFFRRDRMSALESDLAARGIVPVGLFCTALSADMPAVAAVCAERIRSVMDRRQLLRPTDRSSAVLQAFVRRIYIPVLALLLLSLSANAVLSPVFAAERESLLRDRASRERIAGSRAVDNERERTLIRAFALRPDVSRAVICDRIAASVPGPVRLHSIAVEPAAGRFEATRPLQRRENMAEVTGSAPSSDAVAEFVSALSENSAFGPVVLSSIGRDRNSAWLNFRIDIVL